MHPNCRNINRTPSLNASQSPYPKAFESALWTLRYPTLIGVFGLPLLERPKSTEPEYFS